MKNYLKAVIQGPCFHKFDWQQNVNLFSGFLVKLLMSTCTYRNDVYWLTEKACWMTSSARVLAIYRFVFRRHSACGRNSSPSHVTKVFLKFSKGAHRLNTFLDDINLHTWTTKPEQAPLQDWPVLFNAMVRENSAAENFSNHSFSKTVISQSI